MDNFTSPPLLKSGDTVTILAPARKVDRLLIDRSMEIIQGWGLRVVLSENLFSKKHTYMSGSDEERLSDLQLAINDTTIDAILCGRGGYGSSRIVDKLDLAKLKQKPKWLIGFSDITSLHLCFLKAGIKSVHGTMPVLFTREDSAVSVQSLRRFLFEGVAQLTAESSMFNRLGTREGVVVGGNLSLLVDSLGTASEVDTTGTILLIEEIDEYFYKVDRMMTQLKRAGKLSSLNGLVVGHMTDIKNGELTFASRFEEVILNAVSEYNYPVAFNFPTGHENPNLAWPQGGVASLRVTSNNSLLTFLPVKPNS